MRQAAVPSNHNARVRTLIDVLQLSKMWLSSRHPISARRYDMHVCNKRQQEMLYVHSWDAGVMCKNYGVLRMYTAHGKKISWQKQVTYVIT